MKKKAGFFPIMTAFILFSAGPLWAEEEQTLSALALKTRAIVDSAYAFVVEHSADMSYVQKTLQNDPRFIDRENELYIFIHCYHEGKDEAVCCGQGVRPELIGKDMWHLRTPNGRLLFHEIREMIEKDGKGWIEYDWLNPFTRTIQTKRSYARGVVLKDGRKAWVGSGYWME
jgi:signal transduction histidine kinase